jgi:hypothetical protein
VAQAHLRGLPQLIVPDKPRAMIAKKAAPGSSRKMKSSRVSLTVAGA